MRQLEKDKPWVFDGTWSGSGKYIRGIPVGDDVIRHRFTRLYKSDRPYARRLRAVQARIAARRLPPRVYDWSRRGPGGRRQRIVVRPVVNDDSLALVPMTEAEIAASHDAWMREAYPYRYPVEQAMERGVARVGCCFGFKITHPYNHIIRVKCSRNGTHPLGQFINKIIGFIFISTG